MDLGGLAIYTLNSPPMPWGDYGDILLSGMTSHLDRVEGLLQLERVGPFVPPITFPGVGDIVITNDLRAKLEASDMSGIRFRPVLKRHIAFLDWTAWNRHKADPETYPDSGEPEDYILGQAHDPDLAIQIGDLWEIDLERHALTERDRSISMAKDNVFVILSSWDGTDWFKAEGANHIYISSKAKQWLEKTVLEWIDIRPALTR